MLRSLKLPGATTFPNYNVMSPLSNIFKLSEETGSSMPTSSSFFLLPGKITGAKSVAIFFPTKSNHHYLYHHRECYKSHTFMYSRIDRRRATSTTAAILAHQVPYRACVHRPSGRRRTSCSLWCIGHGIPWGQMGAMRILRPMGQVHPLVVGLHS